MILNSDTIIISLSYSLYFALYEPLTCFKVKLHSELISLIYRLYLAYITIGYADKNKGGEQNATPLVENQELTVINL